MPNGKGTLDCSYCKYYICGHGESQSRKIVQKCQYHDVQLPAENEEHLNRICCHFEPNALYWRHNDFWIPPARRFSWFGCDLKPGLLYFFFYNTPENIEKSVTLREPDYEKGEWITPRKDSNETM